MTTTRAYREAMASDAAAAELLRCSGTQVDPGVVEALLAVTGATPEAARDDDRLAA